jgi:hypothetical protein
MNSIGLNAFNEGKVINIVRILQFHYPVFMGITVERDVKVHRIIKNRHLNPPFSDIHDTATLLFGGGSGYRRLLWLYRGFCGLDWYSSYCLGVFNGGSKGGSK